MRELQRKVPTLVRIGVVVLTAAGFVQYGWPHPAAAATADEPAAVRSPVSSVAQSPITVQWAMTPNGHTVRDPTSGLSLALRGQWAATGEAVRFGARGGTGLGTADDRGRLSPGPRDFAVAVRLTSKTVPTGVGYSPNVVQKGLASSGAQWKLTLRPTSRGGRAACRFEGRRGQSTVIDGSSTRIDDGRRHDVVCWRQGGRVGITVDGRTTARRAVIGSITPRTPTTVANKKASGGVDDQFDGSLFCVTMAIGRGSRGAADARLGC